MSGYILTLLVFIPLAGGLLLLLVNRERTGAIKSFAFMVSLINFFISLYLYFNFQTGNPGFQFEINRIWIQSFGINLHLGIDGISLFLVLLTTFLSPLAILSSWSAIQDKVKGYMITMLFLEAGMIGVFVSLDLFLFYVFWEAMLVPMYFLIGIWGGPRKIYATIKFVL
ncbi:MAG: Fe-S-binding domain-containing protein, partial [candidate division Zixibacteria bacterium]|nr:Fe-S-binding domain-containing protein [candidate division Zixibacteria bacterium]